MNVSVIIPAYNEGKTIQETVDRTFKVLKDGGHDTEIILVDDGSTDNTKTITQELEKEYSNLTVLRNEINLGKSVALNRGFETAKGDVFIMMDADLQQVPEDIPILLSKINEGYDVVNGWRTERKDPLSKLIPSKIYNNLASLIFGMRIHDMNTGFKAFRRGVFENIILRPGYFRYILALAKGEGYRVCEVPIRHFKREHGKSKYGLGRLLTGVDIVSIKLKSMFSERPMLLFGSIGGLLLLAGLVSGLYLAYLKIILGQLIGEHIPLLFFTTTSLIGGISTIAMGFLAELIKDLEYKVEREIKKAKQ